jgi:hypothetical protein
MAKYLWYCKHCPNTVPHDSDEPDNGQKCCWSCHKFYNHYGYYPDEKKVTGHASEKTE